MSHTPTTVRDTSSVVMSTVWSGRSRTKYDKSHAALAPINMHGTFPCV